VIIPDGCLLNPSETAAVVGGNVLTSQRIVDVVLNAFQVCAASQVTQSGTQSKGKREGRHEGEAGMTWKREREKTQT